MTVLNANFPLRDQGVSNFVGLETLPRHRWYFVKEGFSPRLVENAIHSEGVGKAKLLVDPFSGGGTVALVGATEGLAVRAFEVNPFLRFLSAAKLRNASAETFKTLCSDVARAFSSPVESPLEDYSTFTEGNRWGRWLFPKEVLRTFEAGRQSIAPASTPERALAKLALIASAMNCCNASRDGKCLRYREDWQSHQATSSDFIASFNARAAMIAEDLSGNRVQGVDSAVTLGDARVLTGTMREKFDLCVTSPPYLNSFDYSDVYRPELFLGRFVSDTKQLQKVRLDAVRSHMQASWDDPKRDEFGSLYQECVKADRCEERAAMGRPHSKDDSSVLRRHVDGVGHGDSVEEPACPRSGTRRHVARCLNFCIRWNRGASRSNSGRNRTEEGLVSAGSRGSQISSQF
jgi:hypothetical protein